MSRWPTTCIIGAGSSGMATAKVLHQRGLPLAHAPSEWIADYLMGRYALPDPVALRRDMEEERARMSERYVASPRHTMQVDFDDYLIALDAERRRGFVLPVAPAARSATVL